MRGNSDMLGRLVGVLRTNSESMVREAPTGVKTKVGAVLAALDPKDFDAIVATFRGTDQTPMFYCFTLPSFSLEMGIFFYPYVFSQKSVPPLEFQI